MNVEKSHKEEVCNSLLRRDHNIGVSIWSIENILNSKEKYKIITYDQLIKSPKKTIFKIADAFKSRGKDISAGVIKIKPKKRFNRGGKV